MSLPQVLGDRWANICRWTEDRWVLLQDVLLKWQRFTEEQVSHAGEIVSVKERLNG